MKIASVALAFLLAVPMALVSAPRAHANQGAVQAASASRALEAGALRGAAGDETANGAFLVPVTLVKASSDEASMAAPVLYKTSYVKQAGDVFVVKLYLVTATVMSSTIYPSDLGQATYDKAGDGVMVEVDADVYDKKTQVRSVTLTCKTLDEPMTFHMGMFMDNVRVKFDASRKAAAEGEPVFDEVALSDGTFPVDSVSVIGGSGDDEANALARCPNGLIVVAGDTQSVDQSFFGRKESDGRAFLSVCSSEGEVLSTSYLSGADTVCIQGLSAGAGTEFFSCGFFQMKEGAAIGDFEGLTRDGCEGTRNAFVAKHNANGKLLWMRSVCCSQACQFDGVAATPDGGCVAVAEYLRSPKGDYAAEMGGIVNTVVVKYDASGSEEWHKVLTGGAVIDTDGAVAVTDKGTYLLAGSFGSVSEGGMLSSAELFGGTFDIYVVELDAKGELVEARSFGGSGSNETVNDVAVTPDGGFVAAGCTQSTDGTFASCTSGASAKSGFVMKCDSAGDVEWIDAQITSQGCEVDHVARIDGGYAAIGCGKGKDNDFANLSKGQQDVFIALYDEVGTRRSLRTFGGSKGESDAGIVALDDGRYAFLVDSRSSDVDLEGLARGGSDAVLAWASGSRSASGDDAGEDARTVASVTTSAKVTYTGKKIEPALTVKAADGSVVPAGSYAVSWKDNVNAGTATVVVTGKGAYAGTARTTFEIAKAPAKASVVKSKTIKAKKLKSKKARFTAVSLKTDGKASFKVVKADRKKVLSFKKGKVTVKKRAKAGTYSLCVRVSAKAGANYAALAAKTYTVRVRVK